MDIIIMERKKLDLDLSLLLDLLRIPSLSHKEEEIRGFIVKYLERYGIPYQIDKEGNVYHIANKGKPLIFAHMDHVGDESDTCLLEFVSEKDGIIFGCGVIGGDDRCGVAIVLQLLRQLKQENRPINFALTTNEEHGQTGATHLSKTEASLLDGIAYGITFDRRGIGDIVTENTSRDYCVKSFKDAVAALGVFYKFKPVVGGISDADTFSDHFSCVNLSAGYIEPHTKNEMILVDAVQNTLNFGYTILTYIEGRFDPPPKRYYSYTQPKTYGWGRGYGKSIWGDTIYDYDFKDNWDKDRWPKISTQENIPPQKPITPPIQEIEPPRYAAGEEEDDYPSLSEDNAIDMAEDLVMRLEDWLIEEAVYLSDVAEYKKSLELIYIDIAEIASTYAIDTSFIVHWVRVPSQLVSPSVFVNNSGFMIKNEIMYQMELHITIDIDEATSLLVKLWYDADDMENLPSPCRYDIQMNLGSPSQAAITPPPISPPAAPPINVTKVLEKAKRVLLIDIKNDLHYVEDVCRAILAESPSGSEITPYERYELIKDADFVRRLRVHKNFKLLTESTHWFLPITSAELKDKAVLYRNYDLEWLIPNDSTFIVNIIFNFEHILYRAHDPRLNLRPEITLEKLDEPRGKPILSKFQKSNNRDLTSTASPPSPPFAQQLKNAVEKSSAWSMPNTNPTQFVEQANVIMEEIFELLGEEANHLKINAEAYSWQKIDQDLDKEGYDLYLKQGIYGYLGKDYYVMRRVFEYRHDTLKTKHTFYTYVHNISPNNLTIEIVLCETMDLAARLVATPNVLPLRPKIPIAEITQAATDLLKLVEDKYDIVQNRMGIVQDIQKKIREILVEKGFPPTKIWMEELWVTEPPSPEKPDFKNYFDLLVKQDAAVMIRTDKACSFYTKRYVAFFEFADADNLIFATSSIPRVFKDFPRYRVYFGEMKVWFITGSALAQKIASEKDEFDKIKQKNA